MSIRRRLQQLEAHVTIVQREDTNQKWAALLRQASTEELHEMIRLIGAAKAQGSPANRNEIRQVRKILETLLQRRQLGHADVVGGCREGTGQEQRSLAPASR